jgi:hypothetical protein
MRILPFVALITLALATITGCGGSEAPAPAPADAARGQQSPMPSDPAAQTVFRFLDAVRRGNGDGEASRMLTPLALKHITERKENIAPPGSPTARFQIGRVAKTAEGTAIVEALWTDVDADGKPYEEPMVCALRLCDGQWRIYGMAEDLGPDRPPMVMDFENLEAGPGPPRSAATSAPSAPTTPPDQMAQDPFQGARR